MRIMDTGNNPLVRKKSKHYYNISFWNLEIFCRMPIGLINAQVTLQKSLDWILICFKWSCSLDYLDDIVIFWPSMEQNIHGINPVLTIMKISGVSLNLKNCRFLCNQNWKHRTSSLTRETNYRHFHRQSAAGWSNPYYGNINSIFRGRNECLLNF